MIYDRVKNLRSGELFVLRRDGETYEFIERWKDRRHGRNQWLNEARHANTKYVVILHPMCHVMRGEIATAYWKAMNQAMTDWVEICKEMREKGLQAVSCRSRKT